MILICEYLSLLLLLLDLYYLKLDSELIQLNDALFACTHGGTLTYTLCWLLSSKRRNRNPARSSASGELGTLSRFLLDIWLERPKDTRLTLRSSCWSKYTFLDYRKGKEPRQTARQCPCPSPNRPLLLLLFFRFLARFLFFHLIISCIKGALFLQAIFDLDC